MAGIYDTTTLVRLVRDLKSSSNFLLNTFFPAVVEYDTEEVAIDVEVGRRRMAPFVSPLVQGKVVAGQGYTTNVFKPPYIKDKRAPDLRRPVRRAMGERIGGDMSPAEREQANLVFEMEDQIRMIDRRLEWMAARALSAGSITVAGDGFPTASITFGRSNGNTVALTSGQRWSTDNLAIQSGVSPSRDIETWATTMLQNSGAAPTDIVFTPLSWALFKLDPLVKDGIDLRRGGDSTIELGGGVTTGGMFKGVWGTYRLWLYNDWFIDPADDTEKPMLTNGTVLMGSAGIEGVRAFGAIMDPKFNYGAMAYAPKTWMEEDPAQRLLMMQSAPLVIPTRPDASFAATVV
jgi:hypothetical protein